MGKRRRGNKRRVKIRWNWINYDDENYEGEVINRCLEHRLQTEAPRVEIMKRFVLNHDKSRTEFLNLLLVCCGAVSSKTLSSFIVCVSRDKTSPEIYSNKIIWAPFLPCRRRRGRNSRGTYHNMNFDVSLYAVLSFGNKFSRRWRQDEKNHESLNLLPEFIRQ